MSANPDSTGTLARVRNEVLDAAGIGNQDLERALGVLMQGDVDNADIYFQVSRQESWTLEDSRVKEAAYSIEQGVGVRAMAGEKTGFAYSDDVVIPALMQASGCRQRHRRGGASRGGWPPSSPGMAIVCTRRSTPCRPCPMTRRWRCSSRLTGRSGPWTPG